MEEQKGKKVRADIVADYCRAHPNSALAKIEKELGIDVGITMLDMFQGKIISFPTSDSLKRTVLPKLIQRELLFMAVNPDSELFKKRVKALAKLYKLSKRAIIEMNKTGIYTR